MAGLIEDYGLVGDMHSAALVRRNGSVDWLCLPRFDSGAVFAALLGDDDNGQWRVAPDGSGDATRRRYVGDSLVLESEWDTPTGSVRVTDFMPPRDDVPNLVRIVEGISGEVVVASTLRLRFDYGHVVPWVRRLPDGLHAVAGPDSVWIHGDSEHVGTEDMASVARFTVAEGDRVAFVLTWHPSHEAAPDVDSASTLHTRTLQFWDYWVANCRYDGPHRDAVIRSLITLKALTFEPTGGIVAAATTSLPEDLGGVRNWDYRYCWLRDAALTLEAFVTSGFVDEAVAWRAWLLRAIAGDPADLQIMYGLAGERRLPEAELPWLAGYENSRPVRIGNEAAEQLQLDVYGEVLQAFASARQLGMGHDDNAWRLQRTLLSWLEAHWREPDEGLWEVRGPRRHFTHSKVQVWAAFAAGVEAVESGDFDGPVERWRAVRDEVHAQVCEQAWNPTVGAFTQSYGSDELDAAVLVMAMLGFLPPDDPRLVATVEAVATGLRVDGGLVLRYRTEGGVDGLPGDEGAFLVCSFWLVDALHIIGREEEAVTLLDRLLALRTDLGLLAEEYDVRTGRLVGNMPQAFSHVGLVNSVWLVHGGQPHAVRDAESVSVADREPDDAPLTA